MPPASIVPKIFNRERVASNRNRAAANFHEYDFLKQRVSRDIVERLKDSPRQFARALDLGCHTGELSQALMNAGQVNSVEATDISAGMVHRATNNGIAATIVDDEALPFDPQTFDLIASAFSLHWVNDLPGTLIQIRTALKPDGLLLAALPGAGSLRELRDAFAATELEMFGGISPRISPFPSLQDMAALLQRAGFALPVADRDFITVRYNSTLDLMLDLRGMGETAAFATGSGRALSRRFLARLEKTYRDKHADQDGRLPASYEIIHISGWAPAPDQPKPLKPGVPKISLDRAINGSRKKTR